MDSSSGFGSTPGDMRAIHTRFRCGSGCHCLNRPPRVTRRIILQKARRQPGLRPRPSTARKQTVSGSISLPSPGCFSPFPHGTVRYRSLRVRSLGKWAPQLHTGLLVSGATQEPILRRHPLSPTRLSRSVATLSRRLRIADLIRSVLRQHAPDWASNPHGATPAGLTHHGFRLLPVRSPLLREYFLFLGVHEMFQFPRCPPLLMHGHRVTTMGLPHSEIVGSMPARGSPTLIAAMPRPSSARSAEASTLCSYCLPCRKTSRWIVLDRLSRRVVRDDHAPCNTLCTW